MADEYGPWIGWNGGECPVDRHTEVETCWISGESMKERARLFNWNCDRLVAYRVKIEPVVETVRQPITAMVHAANYVHFYDKCGDIPGFLVYETRDGKPDMSTLRWEDAD